MAEKEKIFAGEQFFYDDLFPYLELDGTAVTGKEYGPFDWQEVRGRLKVVAEIFGDGGTGTGAVTVEILASDEKEMLFGTFKKYIPKSLKAVQLPEKIENSPPENSLNLWQLIRIISTEK